VFSGLALMLVVDLVRGAPVGSLFRSRIVQRRDGAVVTLAVSGSAVFTNLRGLISALQRLEPDVERVVIDFTDCTVVDHTTQNRLHLIAQEWERRTLELRGLDAHTTASTHPHCAKWKKT
jgi:MFS superfamily sulfate permease-like transporter